MDQTEGEEQVADTTVEAEATTLGWTPKDKWKGNPDRWIDAKTFVERSATILPIVQQNNKELLRKQATLEAQLNEVIGTNRALAASMKAIEEQHEQDVAERVKSAKSEIAKQLKQAREDGDTDLELKLIDDLTDLKVAEKDAKEAEKTPAAESKTITPTADYLAWEAQNPWMKTDQKKAARAVVLGQAIQLEHKGKLTGPAFFEELDRQLAEFEGPAARRAPGDSKVAGGSSRGSGGNSGSRSYADLPKEAKEACDSLANKLVGPGRAHKDAASWRAAYASKYFEGEE